MKEEWRVIEYFQNYEISSFGRVGNIRTETLVKTARNQQGIVTVSLYQDHFHYTKSVAKLAAESFLLDEQDLLNTPYKDTHFDTVIHYDGDRINCRVDNLTWRPRWFAVKYHQQFKYPIFHEANPALIILKTGEQFDSLKEPCIKYGLIFSDIMKSVIECKHVFPTGQQFRYR